MATAIKSGAGGGAPGPPGPPGVVWRGLWDWQANYQANDLVNYGGANWIATAPSQNLPCPNHPEAWDMFVDKGQPGDPGPPGPQGGTYLAGEWKYGWMADPSFDQGTGQPIPPADMQPGEVRMSYTGHSVVGGPIMAEGAAYLIYMSHTDADGQPWDLNTVAHGDQVVIEDGSAVVVIDLSGDMWSWHYAEASVFFGPPARITGLLTDGANVGVSIAKPSGAPGPQGPPGDRGPAIIRQRLEYSFNAQVAAPPAGGQMRFDNADQTQATKMWLSTTTADGFDVANALDPDSRPMSPPQPFVYVQDKDDSSKWGHYQVGGITVNSGYVEYDVFWMEGGLPVPAQRVIVTLTGEVWEV